MAGSGALRKAVTKIVQRGRQILQSILHDTKEPNVGIREGKISDVVSVKPKQPVVQTRNLPTTNVHGRFQPVRGFVAEIRRKAGRQSSQFATGQRLPNYAFVGFGLAMGSKLYGEADPHGYNAFCSTVKRLFDDDVAQDDMDFDTDAMTVEMFELGPLIGKGCNAAVHAAKLKTNVYGFAGMDEPEHDTPSSDNVSESEASFVILDESHDQEAGVENQAFVYENLSQFVDSNSVVDDDIHIIGEYSGFILLQDEPNINENGVEMVHDPGGSQIFFGQPIDSRESDGLCHQTTPDGSSSYIEFPLAVKVVFNYDAQSNASTILQTMGKEIVPSQNLFLNDPDDFVPSLGKRLPPHPNIVQMPGVFVDSIPQLEGALEEYPAALPSRLNPNGCGHNSTLFLVMKRYDETLKDYLLSRQLTTQDSLLLLAQLTEAVDYLSLHGIAHRDIKSDNILLDTAVSPPRVVVTDFGCCLCEDNLIVPYSSGEVSKGGNGALMAPEIACAQPGYRVYLDYSKSDIWAVGAIAYEILGHENPFYRGRDGKRLDSRVYSENDLPHLNGCSLLENKFVQLMMLRDPIERISAQTAAYIQAFLLWAPKDWLNKTTPPIEQDVIEWIMRLTAEVLCLRKHTSASNNVAYCLKLQFLRRIKVEELMSSINRLFTSSN